MNDENINTSSNKHLVKQDDYIAILKDDEESALNAAKTQWQFRDWKTLAQLNAENLESHPDRAALILFAAAGLFQVGDIEKAKQYIFLAQQWGCTKQKILRILISGVYNNIGRIALFKEKEAEAERLFENAISVGTPETTQMPLAKTRMLEQLKQTQSLITSKLSSDVSYTGIFYLPITLPNGIKKIIPFNTIHREYLQVMADELHFFIPDNKPLYLCSNEHGSLSVPSKYNLLNLEFDTDYVIYGELILDNDIEAVLRVNEYGTNEGVSYKTQVINNNKFGFLLKTQKSNTGFCIAIRLTGKGKIDISSSNIHIKKQSKELSYLYQDIESQLYKLVNNTRSQFQASLSIQHYLSTGKLMPDLGKWAISSDFALYLVKIIENNNYDLVIEFGSGTSTLLIAKALNKINEDKEKKSQLITFEHLEEFFLKTLNSLKQESVLSDSIELILTPLKTITIYNDEKYLYYDKCTDHLEKLAKNFELYNLKVLVLVDAPPKTIGKNARYPALPIVMQSFIGAEIDFLLDDYARQDEKDIVNMWQEFLKKIALEFSFEEIKLEKGACIIHIPKNKSHPRDEIEIDNKFINNDFLSKNNALAHHDIKTVRYPTLPQSLQLIRNIVPDALSEIIDIGVKTSTDFLLNVFPDKHHHLFEPVSQYYADIEKNYQNISHTLYKVALSDVSGKMFLHNRCMDGSGKVTHSEIKSKRDENMSFLFNIEEIASSSLDDIFTVGQLGKLNYLIKLDVDGVEEKIIAGGKNIILEASFIVIETSLNRQDMCSRIALLEQCGFRLFDICDHAYYYGQLSIVDLVLINNKIRTENIKFRPWEYASGKLNKENLQRGFPSLDEKEDMLEDPFEGKLHPVRYPTLHHSLHLIRKIAPNTVSNIIDIGVKDKTDFLLDVFPDKHHHLFEPKEIYYPKIKENYRGTLYTLHKITLSDKPENVFSQSENQNISVHKLDDVFAEKFEDLSYLIKLDADGDEEKIIVGGANVIRGASIIIVSASIDIMDKQNLCSQIKLIESYGFRLFDICDHVYYYQQLIQVNLVFLNKKLRETNIKFRPWDYSSGKLIREKWKHLSQFLKEQYYSKVLPQTIEQKGSELQIFDDMNLNKLREVYPFPVNLGEAESYYFSLDGGGREIITDLIKQNSIELMLEIGCFLCGSVIQWFQASNSITILGIDPWELDAATILERYNSNPAFDNCFNKINDREAFITSVRQHGIYTSALANVKAYRDRFIPIKAYSPQILYNLYDMGIKPQLIFIDSNKTLDDMEVCKKLFPNAILAGDDWTWGADKGFPVQKAINEFCIKYGVTVTVERATWFINF